MWFLFGEFLDAGDDGVLVALDAEEQLAKQWSQRERDERDGDGCDAGPDEKGVPLPLPKLTRERNGVGASGCEERFGRERHWLGAEDEAAEMDEWDYQQKFERIDDVVSDLRGGYV